MPSSPDLSPLEASEMNPIPSSSHMDYEEQRRNSNLPRKDQNRRLPHKDPPVMPIGTKERKHKLPRTRGAPMRRCHEGRCQGSFYYFPWFAISSRYQFIHAS
jgi:hypothetical protein